MDEPGPVRQLAAWSFAALAASALLFGVLRWERRHAAARWSPILVGDAKAGAATFAAKGCPACHGEAAPGAAAGAHVSGPGELVTAMWNHAPQMWERMRTRGTTVPAMSQREMANVFAFLYRARAAESRGDEAKGRRLFEEKGCAACHREGGAAPDVPALARVDSAVGWTSAMWNHPPVGKAPPFEGPEMSDLLAFVRGGHALPPDAELLAGDADRGWRLFRERSCAECHGPKERDGRVAPDLGRELPATVVQLAGRIWSKAPAMREAMRRRGMRPQPLTRAETADLAAFLYGVRYSEPGGSPKGGEVLWSGRDCARCHGAEAQGGGTGPALRGRGRRFSAITLAATIWRHGPGMYRQTREQGVAWPTLTEGDVGDLMAFLNTPPDKEKQEEK